MIRYKVQCPNVPGEENRRNTNPHTRVVGTWLCRTSVRAERIAASLRRLGHTPRVVRLNAFTALP